jgi:pyrroline-5-carboxylate reductase
MTKNQKTMQILIIGGGNMGATYAQSFQRSHITNKEGLMILEKSADKFSQLVDRDIATVYQDASECLPKADLIILAVKPQDAPVLFEQLRGMVDPQQVVLSIMAGIKMGAIAEGLGAPKVIRAMPNLPAQIGMGMTVFTSSEEVTRIELVMVQNLLSTTGKTLYVEHEAAIDAATAISGSGPAYVWFFMDAVMEAALGMGFTEAEGELLVEQTFRGAVELHNKTDLSFREWIGRVKSRGGTTEAALEQYQSSQLRASIVTGVQAALNRAIELGE